MDGGTRVINNKFYSIFGVDGIINYHNASTDVPFFHHELFHVYHRQFFSGQSKIWHALWGEGLATYISEVSNPGSTLRDIMLDTPEGLVEACEKDMPYLWSELSKVLDTSDEAAYEKFFLLSQSDPRVPKRAGYYLGYLIAKELNRSYPLDALIRLDGPELQALIQEVVTRRRLE